MGRFFRVEDIEAHEADLIRKGFIRVNSDSRGRFNFKGLSGQLDDYSFDSLNGMETFQWRGARECRCYAKDHNGILIEMHHVGFPAPGMVSIWYKLRLRPLISATRRLVNHKRSILDAKIKWDQEKRKLHRIAQRTRNVDDSRRALYEDSPECRRWSTKLQQLLDHAGMFIDKEYHGLLDAISVRPYPGNFYFTYDPVSTRAEARAYHEFLVAFRDLWPAGPRKGTGGNHGGGKAGPTDEQKRRIKKRSADLREIAKNALESTGEQWFIQELEQKEGIEKGALLRFLKDCTNKGITIAKWADSQAYFEETGVRTKGDAVKKY